MAVNSRLSQSPRIRLSPGLVIALCCVALIRSTNGQIFVSEQGYADPTNPLTYYWRVGNYATTGTPINANLIRDISFGTGLAIGGNTLYVYHNQNGIGTVGSYTLNGTPINPTLITGLNSGSDSFGLAVSGNDLYVINRNAGTLGRYTVSGGVVNATLISALRNPTGLAISGDMIFITDYNGTVGAYTTSGVTVNSTLISGLGTPWGIAVEGNDLYVAGSSSGTVGHYTTAGTTVNGSLISGLYTPVGLALAGGNLYVGNYNGLVGEYTTAGLPIGTIQTGGSSLWSVAVVPEPPAVAIFVIGMVFLLRYVQRKGH